MLWSRRAIAPNIGRLVFVFLVMTGLSACQVRPLYESASSEELQSISIDEPKDVVTQFVRNELVFLLGDGSGEPSAPRYTLNLSASATSEKLLYDRTLGINVAGRVTVEARYTLVRISDGATLSSGRKSTTALIDDLDQDFAHKRAVLDAQKRASREVAEFIKSDLAIILARQVR